MLKFIVVTRPDGLANWQRSCIDALIAAGLGQLEAVWTLPAREESHGRTWAAYAMWVRTRLPEMQAAPYPSASNPHPLPAGAYAPQDCSHVDFVLSFHPDTGSCLRGSPRYGIWELRIGGYPTDELAAIRETARCSPCLTVELVARGGRYDAGEILKRANLKTRRTHLRTLEKALQAAPQICVQACRGLLVEEHFGTPAARPAISPRPHLSTFLLAQFFRTAAGAMRQLFIREEWAIGLVEMPSSCLLDGRQMAEPSWIAIPDHRRFFADPFLLEADGNTHVIFEVYDEGSARGWIGSFALDGARRLDAVSPKVAMRMDCHMSYPHPFEHEGVTYCAPEVSEHGGLVLFRRKSGTMDWEQSGIPLADVPLVDPTIFQHDGRWWLLGTLAGPASDTDLYAWHASSPFGPWKEHALNPVQSDVRCSRPAGSVFTIAGRLYRPAQDCSDGYGRSLVIQEILQLDEQRFAAATRMEILPQPHWSFPHGLHTINIGDGLLVVDAKRKRLQLSRPVRQLLRRLRRTADYRQEGHS